MITGRRLARACSAAAVLAGVAAAAYGLWTPAKAALGQALIADAYESARRAGAPATPPWSWADHRPVAKLVFESLDGAERHVLDNASGPAMAWAPGVIRAGAPLLSPGVSAIAAHRDTHFALLRDLSDGDVFRLETLERGERRYRVLRAEVVDSRRWRLPRIDHGPDLLVLSTCWPFDAVEIGPLRYLVFAAPVDLTASD